MLLLSLWSLACTKAAPSGAADSAAPASVPWSAGLTPTAQEISPLRGMRDTRGLIHLHSPWSHDACDGDPLPDGSPDPECLAHLREGLCTTAMDFAYVTDHPAHAAEQAYEDLFHLQPGDEQVTEDGALRASRIPCDSGNGVLWMPGIEDELMPVGLHRQVSDSAAENDDVYNRDDDDAIAAELAAGAIVLLAHTEQRDVETMRAQVAAGVRGVELFNLHAMFDPDIRSDYLGLDSLSWLTDIAPFTDPDGTAEPDLLFLAVLAEQAPSITDWDALQLSGQEADGPVVGVAGTDAHENALPMMLRDGERGDSYRRMMRWFSNHLLLAESAASPPGPADYDEALQAGRAYVAFEVLGTPQGLDVHLQTADGAVWEIGSSGAQISAEQPGTLHVGCPALSPSSPRNGDSPEITATVFKDGAAWQEGCGDFAVTEAGSYRARIDITPWHLADFLGEDPSPWLRAWPWIYTNPIAASP